MSDKVLKLLDINKFIEDNDIKEVTSPNIFYMKTETFDPDGVYSEEIFGRIGSQERFEKFGFINLNDVYITPEAYTILKQLIPGIHNQIFKGNSIKFDEKNGIFKEVSNGESSSLSIKDIYEIMKSDKFNWDYYKEKNEKVTEFIKNNIDKIFIDKYIVMPAGYRDMQEINGKLTETELSKEYRKLIHLVKSSGDEKNEILSMISDQTINNDSAKKIQNSLIRINKLIKTQMKSKSGFIRGHKLSKRVDHSARLVLAQDRDLAANEVKVPWFILLKLYEPFVIHYISNDSRYADIYSEVEKEYETVSVDSVKKYLSNITQYPYNVDESIKEKLIEILDIIISGKEDGVEKYVIVLRHPVESRDSILGLKPVIDKENQYVARLPQVLFGTLGADCSWDEIEVLINGEKYLKVHIRDLIKHVKHSEIREYKRPDGVIVRESDILDDVKILSYDGNGNIVLDTIVRWIEHENIKMNYVRTPKYEYIMSPSKDTLVTSTGYIVKPTEESVNLYIYSSIPLGKLIELKDVINKYSNEKYNIEDIVSIVSNSSKLYMFFIEHSEIIIDHLSDYLFMALITLLSRDLNFITKINNNKTEKYIERFFIGSSLCKKIANRMKKIKGVYPYNINYDLFTHIDYVINVDELDDEIKDILSILSSLYFFETYDDFEIKTPNLITEVEESDKNIGWDITTLTTGLYFDSNGLLKKQCDGDQINIYALHTKEAIEELKKIDPVKGDKGIYSISNYKSIKVDPSMDISLGVWMLTKEPNNKD